MPDVQLKPRVVAFINSLPPKHQRQVKAYILKLKEPELPHDTKPLKGYKPYLRGDVGEYRVIFRCEKADKNIDVVIVVLCGKRNGDEVYKKIKRIVRKD